MRICPRIREEREREEFEFEFSSRLLFASPQSLFPFYLLAVWRIAKYLLMDIYIHNNKREGGEEGWNGKRKTFRNPPAEPIDATAPAATRRKPNECSSLAYIPSPSPLFFQRKKCREEKKPLFFSSLQVDERRGSLTLSLFLGRKERKRERESQIPEPRGKEEEEKRGKNYSLSCPGQ